MRSPAIIVALLRCSPYRHRHYDHHRGIGSSCSASSVPSLDLPLLHKPNQEFAESIKKSPQLSVKGLPLLSSCLPYTSLSCEDLQWIETNMCKIKQTLKYDTSNELNSVLHQEKEEGREDPFSYLDPLLYLAFQHVGTRGSKRARYVRMGHSRLWFLGQYVMELSLVEYFLLRYPREVTACIRERIFGLTSRKVLPQWICSLGLDEAIFYDVDIKELKLDDKLNIFRAVFWSLLGVSYLLMGMQEVYRILFHIFRLDPEAEICKPTSRHRYLDEDNVFPELKKKKMDWQNIFSFHTAHDALLAKPLLFRACVPPGIRRFRGNLWEVNSLPKLLPVLGYPLQCVDEDPSISQARNAELELGLQLCFLDPLAYKLEHPRFCNERLEYLGQKIQDLVMAERLVIKHLDGPGVWLQESHRRLLFNRLCGTYLRKLKLHDHIVYSAETEQPIYRSKNSQKVASISVSHALHGLGYVVYGKVEVRRLMSEVFDFERTKRSS